MDSSNVSYKVPADEGMVSNVMYNEEVVVKQELDVNEEDDDVLSSFISS